MKEFPLQTHDRVWPGVKQAIDAATARIVAATQGDLSTPSPVIIGKHLPALAQALDDLFGEVRTNLDTVHALAMFDPVTSLPNRTSFRREAERALRGLPVNAESALFFIDLDNFKSVNDTYGHAQGDQLLAMVANRLRSVARSVADYDVKSEAPIAGRLAGDEFTLLVPIIDGVAAARRVARALLIALMEPFDLSGHVLDVGASIGVSLCSTAGHSLTELMRAADVAMYHAKTSGRGQFQFYSEALAEKLADRTRLENDLRAGIERNELALLVQPQVSLIDGSLVTAEALLRWNHPVDGLLMPHSFLQAAEESGLIFEISEWSVRAAMGIVALWESRGLANRLSVNLSARQMNRADFFPNFWKYAAEMNISVGRFEVEVTEANMNDCGDAVFRELAAMRNEGARVTIDTVGVGMSGLARLRHWPVDRLKIHRSMSAEIVTDKGARAVAQAMIGLAHGLGYEAVAAGVETQEQIDILRVMGCDAVQGYAIAPPMSLDAFADWRSAPKKRARTPA
jgi:diguanylate cyclase